MSFFSHLDSRVSDSAWEDEAPLTVEPALNYLSGEFSECCEFTPMQVVGVPCYENGDDMDMCTVRDSAGGWFTR